MEQSFIIKEIRRVVELLGRENITRDEFLNNSELVTRRDIEKSF
jgi:hypothetical protein